MSLYLLNYVGLIFFFFFPSQHTDEEVEGCFEEFYEDVHTEFLKFGEIVNFKVVDCCPCIVFFKPNMLVTCSHLIVGCCVFGWLRIITNMCPLNNLLVEDLLTIYIY